MVNQYRFCRVVFTLLLYGLLVGAVHAQEIPQTIHSRPPLAVLDVQYSPNGRYLARVYAEGRLEVLDAFTNRLMLEDSVELPNPLFSAKIDWSPTGDRLAAGIGAHVYVWDIENAQLIETIEAGGEDPLVYFEDGSYLPEGIVSLQWDSTGTLLLTKSMSSHLTVWSTEQQTFIFDRVVGNNPVPVVWLADNQHITNGSSVFDIQTQEFVVYDSERLPGVVSNCGPYFSIASNSNRTRIIQATGYGCIVIRDAATGDEIAGYQLSAGWSPNDSGIVIAENINPIWDVSWSPDDSKLVAVDSLGAVQVVDIATGSITLIDQQAGALYAVDWTDTNTAIAYGGNTLGEDTVFATISVAEVERLMISAARQPEFAITPSTDR